MRVLPIQPSRIIDGRKARNFKKLAFFRSIAPIVGLFPSTGFDDHIIDAGMGILSVEGPPNQAGNPSMTLHFPRAFLTADRFKSKGKYLRLPIRYWRGGAANRRSGFGVFEAGIGGDLKKKRIFDDLLSRDCSEKNQKAALDGFVKSPYHRHPGGSRGPERLELTGFRLSPE